MSFRLSHAVERLEGEDIEQLARLDRHGFLIGPGESFTEYRERLALEAGALDAFEAELKDKEALEVETGVAVRPGDRIPPAMLLKSGELTQRLYSFKLDWAPGFFVREGVGFLWGGCAWHDPEKHRTLFLIRDNFRKSERYWVYSRRELVAHELCHVARAAFDGEWQLEELYAYRTSASPLRRYLGNCFVKRFDALIFLAPSLIILMAQIVNVAFQMTLPLWPGWLLLGGCLGYLLTRNHLARRRFFRVRRKLRRWMPRHAQSLMFRATWEELGQIHRLKKRTQFEGWLQRRAGEEMRWRVIRHRFITNASGEDIEQNES